MVDQTVEELLVELNQRGIKLWADGNNLRSKSPKDGLTPTLRAAIREHKDELLLLLSQLQTSQVTIPSVPRNRSLPLSFAEQRLWFIHQLEPGTATYNIPLIYRLSGALNRQALENSITHLIRRHESLRTTFTNKHEGLVRVIAQQESFVLSFTDLSTATDDKREAELKRQIDTETNFCFNLQDGPLFRVNLLRLADKEHIFLINMHHIISDGWSMNILWRDLAALYDTFCQNMLPSLPELTIQYADFAHWQRKRDDVLSRQLSYWKNTLSDSPPLLALPTDHQRPYRQRYLGASIHTSISPNLTQALHALSKQKGVTLFMLLLAVFKVLLFRYSAQEDVIVGTPIANRTMGQIENVIGFFINTLVLRSDLSSNPTFIQLLEQVRNTTLDAYQNQDLPFEKLVEELSPERTLNHHSLFQVMFVLQNTDEQAFTLTGLEVNHIPKKQQTSKFDLMLTVTESKDTLEAQFSYNSDLFEESTIKRMVGHFQTLLESIVAIPETPISALPLMTEAEQDQLSVDWNNTEIDFPHGKDIHQLFEEQTKQTPHAIALIFGNDQLTYDDLNSRANQLAHYLRSYDINKGKVVGVCLPRSFDVTVTLLAIFKLGGVYLPLDPSLPPARKIRMLSDAAATLVVTKTYERENLKDCVEQIICIDSEFASITKQSATNLSLSNNNRNEPAYIIYTSGSTGQPKGTLVPHRQLLNRLHWMWKHYPFETNDMSCQKTAISFVDSLWELLGPLLQGSPTVILSDQTVRDPESLIAALQSYGVTRLWVVPTLLQMMLNALSKTATENQLPQLKFLVTSGEILPTTLYREFQKKLPHCSLYNLYGTSEIWDATWYKPSPNHQHLSSVPIGKPIDNVETYILDKHLQPVPIGVTGELCVSGAGLADKYLNQPDLTAKKFILHPVKPNARLYRSGDLARYLVDGNIELVGRKDNQIKIRGYRVEPDEVEAVLNQHPDVREAAVAVNANTSGEKSLVAYIVPNDIAQQVDRSEDAQSEISLSTTLDLSQLREFFKGKLSDFMIPSVFMILSEFPLTSSGKINRPALQGTLAKQLPSNIPLVAPRDSLERQLANLWEEALHISPIGVYDDFFDLGGHSLLAVSLFDDIQKLTGQKLPLSTLFEMPTIAQQAKILGRKELTTHHSSLVAIQPKGIKPPLFLVPPAGGTGLGFRKLAHHLGQDQPIYTFEPFAQVGIELPHTSVEEIAAYYVHELRELQPDGQYRLGGMCFGGHVAWEMAYQLEQEGIAVDTLLMLDPAPPANGPTWRLSKRTTTHLRQRAYHHALHGTLGLVFKARWRRFKALFDKRTQRFRQLRQTQRQALKNYRAQSFNTTMLLVQSEQLSKIPEFHERWQTLAKGNAEIAVIPKSTHRSILVENEAHIKQLAEFVQDHLTKLESDTNKSNHS